MKKILIFIFIALIGTPSLSNELRGMHEALKYKEYCEVMLKIANNEIIWSGEKKSLYFGNCAGFMDFAIQFVWLSCKELISTRKAAEIYITYVEKHKDLIKKKLITPVEVFEFAVHENHLCDSKTFID